ncbi:MAG: serine hydrolase domain-containing protein [Phenylobacterium sp.]|uniref:serine hydrolase domain-containing protein n=1 Tax=Phenylobacterium sp. TaxID=1871053 RepID=UPI002727B025|nr:serine hydrolase domain-containing protein [Phenylobacterium sp.]MDO8902533.1 serine hydrolase domain-containing protein [Phenylobacterium sp.]
MDGDFSASGMEAIGPALQGVVDSGDLSGFVTLVWRKGEVVQVDTIGRRDIGGDKPMTRDTIFRIASMTKPITSVAALMLLEEGRLQLEDPITRWAPEFSDMRVLKAADGPLDQTVPASREITIEDLMTHRAGLAYGFTSVGPIAQAHEKALGPALGTPLTPDEWMKRLSELPLSYQPGARFHYSHATDVLGFIVARIEGKPLDQVLQDRIFGPLGMTDTAFHVPPEKLDRGAKLYRINPKTDAMEEVPFPYHPAPPVFAAGGGGLVSTADDYLKFARLMLGKGEVDGVRLLKTATVEMMTADRLTDAQKAIPFMGIPFWLGQGFGLGVSVITDPVKQAWMGAGNAGAFGWPGAFGTWWQADPQADMVLIYLIQNSIELGPEAAAQLATGQRMGGRAALPVFQKMVYGALGS